MLKHVIIRRLPVLAAQHNMTMQQTLSFSTVAFLYLASFIYVRTSRAEAPFLFVYKALLHRSVPQPFLFMLRYFPICIYRLIHCS